MPHELTHDEKLALESFPLAAREFCRFVGQSRMDQREPFIQQLFGHLARICEIAIRLPWVDPTTEDVEIDQDDIRSKTDECFKLADRLRTIFGKFDNYWEIFDSTQKEEAVNGSLANDVAEICMDLKDALSLVENGTDLNDAHWQWRFDFRNHWGRHAVSALKAMYDAQAWDYER
jgi:hypothetical protein